LSTADAFEITTSPESYQAVRDVLERAKVPIAHAEVTRIAENTVKVSGHAAEQVLKLMEELEEHDDVQSVSANFDIDDQEIAQFSAA
jgi:transcriptional/translational regulatory protein YebC/TACO1